MLQRLTFRDNPCLVEVDFYHADFILPDAIGSDWRNLSKEQLEERVKRVEQSSLFDVVPILYKLVQDGKISDMSNIVYLFNLELPSNLRGQGYATKALNELIRMAKNANNPYEYIICTATTNDGNNFVRRRGFEHLSKNYWGLPLKK